MSTHYKKSMFWIMDWSTDWIKDCTMNWTMDTIIDSSMDWTVKVGEACAKVYVDS